MQHDYANNIALILKRIISIFEIRGVHKNSGTDPPTQTAQADLMSVMGEDRFLPPKTDLGWLDGGFSFSKSDIPNPTDETHERKPEVLDLFKFIDISVKIW